MDTTKLNILIVGATGNLGSLVTKHCLTKPNLTVNILIRDTQKNKDLVSQVESAGGKAITGDITQPDTIKGITKGMHTVIFTLPPFGENVTVDGQLAVIKDCIENNVKRVVPAEYGKNSSRLPLEEIKQVPVLHSKIKIREFLKDAPIKSLMINTGTFLDSFLQGILSEGNGYWGDADQKYPLTSYEDTARFIAAAVAREDLAGDVSFVANESSINEAVEAYNKVRGTSFKPVRFGSLEELKAKAEEGEKKGDPSAGWLRILHYIFDERTSFDKTNNEEFPEVGTVSIEEVLRQQPNIVVK